MFFLKSSFEVYTMYSSSLYEIRVQIYFSKIRHKQIKDMPSLFWDVVTTHQATTRNALMSHSRESLNYTAKEE
jgi:hypothetical protein